MDGKSPGFSGQMTKNFLGSLPKESQSLSQGLPYSSSKEKIALWCDVYKEFYGQSYKVTQAERGWSRTYPFDGI